jgi:type IV pilus assembly protein PilM
LTLFNVQFQDRIRITALRVTTLDTNNRDESILDSLKKFIQDYQIQHKNAILSPSLNSLVIKRIELPAMPQSELQDAIKWQIKEDVPYDLSQAAIDYSIIQKRTKEDGASVLDIMCVVALEKEIKSQVLLLKQLGFSCLSVGILPFGYERLFAGYLKQQTDESIGILHLASEICYIMIFKNKKLEFYRELPISINKLKESLRGVLVSDKGKIELSNKEIDEVLFKIGVPLSTEQVYQNKLSAIQILSMIRPNLERLASEIRRSFSYYDTEFGLGAVNRVFIAGDIVKVPNVEKFLSRELALDIGKISLRDQSINYSRIDEHDLLRSLAVFGLAVDYKNNINLLPYEFRTEKIEKVEKISLRWIAFLAFLLLVVSYLFARAGISAYQKRLDNALLQVNVLSEVKQIKTRVVQMTKFIADIRKSEPHVAAILKKLSNITSRELFFRDFSLDCESKIGSISGYVRSSEENPDIILTKFVRDMENSVYFTDTSIVSVKKRRQENIDITEFQINFKLP